MSRKEKRAAKAELKSDTKRAAKVQKPEKLQEMLQEARESGKQSVLKRCRANAVTESSDDDDTVSVFDRIRSSKGAPKSVKAARRKQKVMTIVDLLSTDEDIE